jgi:uncharacterized membrane protein
MYNVPSYAIALALFLTMLVALYVGALAGSQSTEKNSENTRVHANSVQGSLLGLLALLLGFTFSLALERHADRSTQVVNEANAIGTAWLRTDLVSSAKRAEVKALFRQYAEVRMASVRVAASDDKARTANIARASSVFVDIWDIAVEEAEARESPVIMGFLGSLNDMADALASRDAAIDRHVPELVLYLLFGTFVLLGGVVGFSSGLSGVRISLPAYSLMILIAILVFIIIDLDRPRRGLIEVDQSPLEEVVEEIRASAPDRNF